MGLTFTAPVDAYFPNDRAYNMSGKVSEMNLLQPRGGWQAASYYIQISTTKTGEPLSANATRVSWK
jgi:hypothetical protein